MLTSYDEKGFKHIPRKADFTLDISGDSMSPDFPDGSFIYVQNTSHLENGQFGIFDIDGELTFKKYHMKDDGCTELISLNKKYSPLTPANYRIIGKVIFE